MDQQTEKILQKYTEETKRHFDVVMENVQSGIKAVAEQVAANAEKLSQHDQRFGNIEDTLSTIKLDMEFIKNNLKKKVDIDEFAALERRVSLLENKIKSS